MITTKPSSFYPLMECRQITYDILRRGFLEEPSLEFLAIFNGEQIDSLFPFVGDSEDMDEGVTLLKQFCIENNLISENLFNLIHWDYTRMFIGPNELPAPPWESTYLNKERLLFQEETLKVRNAYLKYAFIPKYYGQEADDHLGLELDFMFQLTQMAMDELEKGNESDFIQILTDQKAFLEEHLLRWVPTLSDKILESAQTDFYRGMALILKGFLFLDLLALNELLDK